MAKVKSLVGTSSSQVGLSEEFKQVSSPQEPGAEDSENTTGAAVPFAGFQLNENTKFILMLVGMLAAFVGIAILLFKIAGA